MAYSFNGTNQDLNVTSSPVTARPMTLAAWFNTGSTGLMAMVSNEANGGAAGFALRLNAQKVVANVFAGSSDNLNGATSYTLNSWQHGCAIFASSSRFVYLNGLQDASDSNSTLFTPNNISIGSRDFGSQGLYYNGTLAEVGIWNAALTAEEVASLAKGMTCDKVRPQNLVFYAPLVRDLQDVRGGLTITNNNAATVATHPRVYA